MLLHLENCRHHKIKRDRNTESKLMAITSLTFLAAFIICKIFQGNKNDTNKLKILQQIDIVMKKGMKSNITNCNTSIQNCQRAHFKTQ